MSSTAGELYVVATPIGNLDDITIRGREVLESVELILAEDTRHSKKLLEFYAIKCPVQSCHEYNEGKLVKKIVGKLLAGQSIALITDAGTPLISDPGYILLDAVHEQGIRVVPVPGPSAVTCALSVAGLPAGRYVFEGFLPAKAAARRQRLLEMLTEARTMVFYEAPHRVMETLVDMQEIFGHSRRATLAKELTKQFESVHRSTLEGILDWLKADPLRVKGEFVLVISGNPQQQADSAEAERIIAILLKSMSVRDASLVAAEILGMSKNRLYRLALRLAGEAT